MTYFSPDKPNSYGLIAPPYKAEDWPISRTRDLNLMAAVLDSKGIVAHEVARITPWLTWLRREPRAKLGDGQRTYVSQIARQMGRLEFPGEFLAKPEAPKPTPSARLVSADGFRAWMLGRKLGRWKRLIATIRADRSFPRGEVTEAEICRHIWRANSAPAVAVESIAALEAYRLVVEKLARRGKVGHPCSGVTSSSMLPVHPQPEHHAPRST